MLFETGWWRERLACLGDQPPSVLLHVREDLSSPSVEVVEFRLRAPDGLRLVGLRARRRLGPTPHATCVRIVRATDPLRHDPHILEDGCTDIVVQLPPHHSLEQRVLDLILALRFAESDGSNQRVPVLVDPSPDDEVAIASRLYLSGLGTLPG